MFKKLFLFIVILSIGAVASHHLIFTIPNQTELVTASSLSEQKQYTCYQNTLAEPLDTSAGLGVLVWNIYKQNRPNWAQSLERFSKHSQIVLLQEASMTKELKGWIKQAEWGSNQVNAFEAFNTSAGVLSLAKTLPTQACGFTYTEPWLQLPKSALWTLYSLDNGETLAVVNIHAVNFTLGTEDYQSQLSVLTQKLSSHQGPMIFAGDFNSWSEARMDVLKAELTNVGLKEVAFNPDNRTQFVSGLPLDHVFYRDLALDTAEASITDASDHNPLLVRFRLLENQ
ncbi:endonuclease/exonuclease/phosphatase family protein [Vibrio sp. T187]|uniref:endonuclease/exonuclease/phosphatase family protein n=1 Tax=Vibrio TaxID=662 RepID=UPI0010CA10C8|nr:MULTISPECIES: endonuclease/exonuclease/phosphatase family protein [Vibrio]MBW3694370.1 endonuclease/exonuclease/phosphatase family protein [Vibrio sp. T187]